MPGDVLLALVLFAAAAAGTPGPNNIMLLASGVNFGFMRTVPHMIGIFVGFVVLIAAVGIGLGVLFKAFPILHTALKVLGAVYLLYLAWRIATSRGMSDAGTKGHPMTTLEAALFQWVNPKGWTMAISAMAFYTQPDAPMLSVAIIVAVFSIATVFSVTLWTSVGTTLRGFLSDPVRLKWFNIGMALLLVASILLIVR
ncbi:LysE family translocator [Tepidamorphus sp. 3E244]|uniref:LysE family translocator n=1 Tax=Tepidamorphus sp. 3E244 TaxID=3385498 RepID=UPI0038FD3E3B